MGAVVAFRRKPEPAVKLQCMGCGALADVACDCGKPYVPVSVRAAEAIRKDPTKSDRAIAAELGISQPSVSRARRTAGDTRVSPDKRVGKDGKKYPAKPKKKPKLIVSRVSLDNMEDTYEELLNEFTSLVHRFRHLSDRQIRQALGFALKRNS